MECIVCGNMESIAVTEKDYCDMVKCTKCGLVYAEPMPSVIEMNAFYEKNINEQLLVESDGSGFLKSCFSKRFEGYKEIIQRHSVGQSKMLGIGKSSSELLKILKKNEFEVYGVKLGGKENETFDEQLGVQMFSENFLDLETDLKFDFISAINIIESFPDPSKIIRKVSELLNDRGYLLLEVPNYNCTESILNQFFFDKTLRYSFYPDSAANLWGFDKNTIRMFMENSGFEVIELKTINPDDLIDNDALKEGYYISREGITTEENRIEEQEILNSINKYSEEELNQLMVHNVGKKLINYTLKEAAKFSEAFDNKPWIWMLVRKKDKRIDFKGNEAKEDIKFLIELGQLELALKFAKEFRERSPMDIEIYSIEAVAEMMSGNFEVANKLLLKGLKINYKDSDLNYNLAYLYELKEEYLKALETYEAMVFNMEDTEERREIIKLINEFEVEHRDQIQIQLDQNKEMDLKNRSDGKMKNLHVMYDSIYCHNFIHFVNKNFPNEEHDFIIIGSPNQELKYINIENCKNVFIMDLKSELQLFLNYIGNSGKIFVHYLFDYFCRIMCNVQIKTPIYWIVWGGDLTLYIDQDLYQLMTKKICSKDKDYRVDKNDIDYIYRKAAYRKISYVLTYYPVGFSGSGEYDLLKENFITAAKPLRFGYQNQAVYPKLENENKPNKFAYLKERYKNVILVGNSANPTNNHSDTFFKLKELGEGDFCVVVPLSYGGESNYVNVIIRLGKELFGEQFIAVTEYMDEEEYIELLSVVDIGVFNHNRQQGFATMLLLLRLGKTVYAKYNKAINDIFTSVKANNFYSISMLSRDSIKENPLKIDSDFENRIEATLGDEAIRKYFSDILEGDCN